MQISGTVQFTIRQCGSVGLNANEPRPDSIGLVKVVRKSFIDDAGMYTVCHIAHRFARYIIVDKADSIVDGMPINEFPVFLNGKTNDIGDSGIGHSPRHTRCLSLEPG